MKPQIETIEKEVLKVITTSSHDEASKIQEYAGYLGRLAELKQRYSLLDQDLQQIENLVFGGNIELGAESLASSNILEVGPWKVTISWKKMGIPKNAETICLRKGSDTLVNLIETLYKEMGVSAIQRLEKLYVNRGPLITKNPDKDYSYGNGKHYQSQQIPNSAYWVITNNGTDEKTEICSKISESLGFRGAIVGQRTR